MTDDGIALRRTPDESEGEFAERCAAAAQETQGFVAMKYGTLCSTCASTSEYSEAAIRESGCCYNCGKGY